MYYVRERVVSAIFNSSLAFLVFSSGCGEGPLAGGQRPGGQGHVHDGFSERQIRPLRNTQSRQPAFQNQDHQREFASQVERSV